MNNTSSTEMAWAKSLLDGRRDAFRDGALLLIDLNPGSGATDYLRALMVHANKDTGDQCLDNITWAIGQTMGYQLRDRNGQWTLALNGGGYSKPLEIAIALRRYYGLENLRYETI